MALAGLVERRARRPASAIVAGDRKRNRPGVAVVATWFPPQILRFHFHFSPFTNCSNNLYTVRLNSIKGWAHSEVPRARSRPAPPLAPCGPRKETRGDDLMAEGTPDDAKKSADDVREEFEEKIDRLRRQYERDLHSFRYEIEEREDRLKAYEDKFNKIKQPPLLYAYVVRKEGTDLDGNQVVVARATELLKASTGLVDKTSLGLGQYVWVHPQTYAIVEGSAVRNEGVIAKVVDMLDGKLVISIEGDMEKRLIDTAKTVYK